MSAILGLDTKMEYGVWDGQLEVRARDDGGRTISASFPYGKTATVRSKGRARKERFASGSLSWQTREFEKLQVEMNQVLNQGIEDAVSQMRYDALLDNLERRNTHLLVGHDFNKPIGSMRGGNLRVKHTPDAVEIEADIGAAGEEPTWVEDAIKSVRRGGTTGVSPGFEVPATKGSERFVPEPNGPSMIREIQDAVAFEYSLVSRPSYVHSAIDVRAEDFDLAPHPLTVNTLWL